MSFQLPLPDFGENDRVLSVWELTFRIKDLLETSFPAVWVEGEISNLSRPRSGHCYLTLKDERAQISAVIWRNTAARLRFDLQDGLEVACRGEIGVYPPHGKYQLIVRQVQPKGIGALELAFRQLHDRLAAEGLFDPRRKRPVPKFVRRVAVVTSPSGAAIHDFLQVLRRRSPGTRVLLVPVRVQGQGAAAEIAGAIRLVNRLQTPLDCLVVTRGGGSLEDLWAFNEEVVVRAICGSRIPVVSAVGHEIDVTLSDLAADVRALTPSESAERMAPSMDEVSARLRQYQQRLMAAVRSRSWAARSRLDGLAGRRVFRRPLERIQNLQRKLDDLSARCHRAVGNRLAQSRQKTDWLAARLNSLSPLAVLGRGYSLTQRVVDGKVVHDAGEVAVGDLIDTRFARGRVISRVEESGESPVEGST